MTEKHKSATHLSNTDDRVDQGSQTSGPRCVLGIFK